MPEDTSDTASARCLSNHSVTVDISGTIRLPAAMPISSP